MSHSGHFWNIGKDGQKVRSPEGQKFGRLRPEVQMEKSECKEVQMGRSPKVQKSKDQKSGRPEDQKSGRPEVQKSGWPEVQKSRWPDSE